MLFGGLEFMNPRWLLANPDALVFPSPKADPYVAVEVHNYDPYAYCSAGPTQHSWGTPADKAKTLAWVQGLEAWARARSLSVVYGEFGVTHDQSAATGRISWYKSGRPPLHQMPWAGFS